MDSEVKGKCNCNASAPKEIKFHDISLLSPINQDRAYELIRKLGDLDGCTQPTITEKELQELDTLLRGLPLVHDISDFSGPKIEVPKNLEYYWRWIQPADGWRSYSFSNLGKVETVRFVELCVPYGWDENLSSIELNQRMIPLSDWRAGDKAKFTALLDKAAHR